MPRKHFSSITVRDLNIWRCLIYKFVWKTVTSNMLSVKSDSKFWQDLEMSVIFTGPLSSEKGVATAILRVFFYSGFCRTTRKSTKFASGRRSSTSQSSSILSSYGWSICWNSFAFSKSLTISSESFPHSFPEGISA